MGHIISRVRHEILEEERRVSSAVHARCDFDVNRLSDSLSSQEYGGLLQSLQAARGALNARVHGGGLDDRQMLLEDVLTWMANHPNLELAKQLEAVVIDFLYKDLPHPPAGYISLPRDVSNVHKEHENVTYAFRPADGSHYNPFTPTLGMAGQPYSRSVPSSHPLPASFLPDPNLVFDLLLKREKFVPHPAGVSSLFFAFADLVIHSIFNTSREDPTINNASSYLDLSPLYGSSTEEVQSVRRMDGTGKLLEDVFADRRLLLMPPSVCALLVLLCRNHNFIADKLYTINEQNTFKPPKDLNDAARKSQDDELFERSRLVNCGFFMQIILGDYVGAILGLVRDGNPWRLKILEPLREMNNSVSPRGEGNVVSVEFNLMYRWHSTLSEPDTAWIEQRFASMIGGKDFGQLDREELKTLYHSVKPPSDVTSWSFGGLKRQDSGKFNDADLAKILHDATETPAGAFKARGIPEALRMVEIMTIQTARRWGTCSLNEFRRFMGLKPYASFGDWNPDPAIARAAESLYHDIENLELHVGLQAEETKAPGPGAGLCPGFTMSRAILSDAVCLTRGDRFLTQEFTPQNYTAWGYQDCQFDKSDGSYGGMLTKLLLRHLPEYFPVGSTYAHFPFIVPSRMQQAMQDRADPNYGLYTWARPVPLLRSSATCISRSVSAAGGKGLDTHPTNPFLSSDESLAKHRDDFARLTQELMKTRSVTVASTSYVDIVHDVVNLVPVYWISELLQLSIKDERGEAGDYHAQHLYETFTDLAEYLNINTSVEAEFSLCAKAKVAATDLMHTVALDIPGNLTDSQLAPIDPRITTLFTSAEDASSSAQFAVELAATAPLYSRTLARALEIMLDDSTSVVYRLQKAGTAVQNDEIVQAVRAAFAQVEDTGVKHGMMGAAFVEATVPAILASIFTNRRVSRVPGRSGKLWSITEAADLPGGNVAMYLDTKGKVRPWPMSLTLQYS